MSDTVHTDHPDISLVIEDTTAVVKGALVVSTIPAAERSLAGVDTESLRTIDCSDVGELDTAGAVFLVEIAGGHADIEGLSDTAREVVGNVRRTRRGEEKAPGKARASFDLERLGGLILKWVDEINEIAVLVVDVLYWSAVGLFDRSQYRRQSFTEQAFYMGSTALPIVATIMFLIGAISALQSASTLQTFGASVFVADMLALGLARELAPLMSAIIISGRSGSAIASEVATMKFTEELDAIKTMGLNPLRFVVVPKLWAMVVSLPLLTVMALILGLLGGFVVSVTYLELTPSAFYNRLLVSLFFWDITTGLIKSVSFAVIITVVGTYRGLTFKGGADGVGRATTESVVTSIFAIIVMDSIWSIIFYFRP